MCNNISSQMRDAGRITQATNREDWLLAMANKMRPRFIALGAPLPDDLYVSCGFTGGGKRAKAVGECHHNRGNNHVFLRPDLWKTLDVAETLCHELIHVALNHSGNIGHGHKKDFQRLANALNLKKPYVSTSFTWAFYKWVRPWVLELGMYPQAKFVIDRRAKKPTDPMVNLRCEVCDFFAKGKLSQIDTRLRCPACNDHPELKLASERL